MRILDSEAMREVDRAAIEDIGIPSLVLMENAAIGLADAIGEIYPDAASVAIFCGPGNNGGDGLALARHLTARGYHVQVSLVTGGSEMRGDALTQLEICRLLGLAIEEYGPEDSGVAAVDSAHRLDLAVDALFGTGLTRPLGGHFAEWVTMINTLSVPCVAVDLPSGLDASAAQIMGPHVQAEMTVAFGAPKIAHILPPAAEAVGEVVIADLGIPAELVEQADGDLHLLEAEELSSEVSTRLLSSHKGDYGHAVIVAGSVGKAGAAILAAQGAMRSGAGLVTVATPGTVAQTVDLGSLESMTLPLEEGPDGLAEESIEKILHFVHGKQVLALGPGLGTEESTLQVIRAIVRDSEAPVVLDADGLNAFAGAADAMVEGRADRILTPHPGELARLLGVTAGEIQADRVASARSGALRTDSVVVLKGHKTLIAEPAGRIFVNPTGNPGMASGGTGDVLTGIITGLVSRGLEASVAARLGTYLHGSAGDLAGIERGEESLTASDILQQLPEAFRQLRS